VKIIENQWYQKVSDSVMKRFPILDEKWTYDYGVVFKGMELVWKITGDHKYYDYIKQSMDQFINEKGEIRDYHLEEYNIDHINNGKLLFLLYEQTGEEKYKKAIELLISQLKTHPRTKEGGFWHKKIYPDQMWLDGIYMGSPFYAEYGKKFNHPKVFDDVAKQVILCANHTKDPKTGLHYHAWDEKHEEFWCNKETGCSKNFWGRAMGWFVAAIVDILDYMPEDHKDHPEIIEVFQDCIEALLRVRDPESGVWYQVLDQGHRPGNYLEASCSCMFLYAITKGIKKGYISEEKIETAKDIYKGIITQFIEVREDGLVNLNKTCQVAGLGNKEKRDGTFVYYISEPIICNDLKGIGAFIQASAETETLS